MDRLWEQRRESWVIKHHPGVSAVHAPSKSLPGSPGPASARSQASSASPLPGLTLDSLSPVCPQLCDQLLSGPAARFSKRPSSSPPSLAQGCLVLPVLGQHLSAHWPASPEKKGTQMALCTAEPRAPHSDRSQSHSQCSGLRGRGWLAGGPEEARQGQCARARVLRLGHGSPLGEVPAARVAWCPRSACVHTPL